MAECIQPSDRADHQSLLGCAPLDGSMQTEQCKSTAPDGKQRRKEQCDRTRRRYNYVCASWGLSGGDGD